MNPNRIVPGLTLLLAALLALAGPARAASVMRRPVSRSAGAMAWPIATAVLRIATFPFGFLWRSPEAGGAGDAWPANGRLERTAGWQRLGFPLAEPGRGVMIEVRGKAEIRAVEILFDDGERQPVNLDTGHTYDRGLYELARFDAERGVRLVRCAARARSARAELRVLIVREGPDPAAALQDATRDPSEIPDSRERVARSFVLHGFRPTRVAPGPRD